MHGSLHRCWIGWCSNYEASNPSLLPSKKEIHTGSLAQLSSGIWTKRGASSLHIYTLVNRRPQNTINTTTNLGDGWFYLALRVFGFLGRSCATDISCFFRFLFPIYTILFVTLVPVITLWVIWHIRHFFFQRIAVSVTHSFMIARALTFLIFVVVTFHFPLLSLFLSFLKAEQWEDFVGDST